MFQRVHSIAVAIGAGLFLAAGFAAATPTTNFTTAYSTWSSVSYITGSPVDLNMSISSSGYSTPAGDAVGGFDFTGMDNGSPYLKSLLISSTLNGHAFNNEVLQGGPDPGAYINVSAPAAGENAMLLYLTTTSSTPIIATLSDGEHFTFNTASNVVGVFGFTSSSPMAWMTFSTSSGSQVLIADLQYGVSSLPQDQDNTPTPEAATAALVGGGILTFLGSRRKLFRKLSLQKQ